jgi:hypothetical protein
LFEAADRRICNFSTLAHMSPADLKLARVSGKLAIFALAIALLQ